MNLDDASISLGTLIKIGVPGVTLIIAATTFWMKVESHHKLQTALDARVNAIECSLSIKRCDGVFSPDLWATPAMAPATPMESLTIDEYEAAEEPSQ